MSDDELLAYLDEMLPAERAAQIEAELRDSPEARQHAAMLIRRRDQGGHTVGEIWRRQRLSCLSRSQLGSWLLGTLDDGEADYVEFHLRVIGCRYCQANLEDLEKSREDASQRERRRRKYFESSAGSLRQPRE
jgi:hypothetical protein